MHATIDSAGRVVIPAAIRERLGLVPGPVEVMVDGTGVRIEADAGARLTRSGDLLVIDAAGPELTADQVRELRHADQR